MTTVSVRASHRTLRAAPLFASLLLLGACGDGSDAGPIPNSSSGSSSGPPSTDTGTGNPVASPTNVEEPVAGTFRDTSLPLNPHLPGTFLVFDEETEAYRMDPRTGRAARIDPHSWGRLENDSEGIVVYPVSTDPDDGYLVTQSICEGLLFRGGVDCLHLQDGDAVTHTSYRFESTITSAVRQSPSGRYLAFFSSPGSGSGDLDSLEVILAADGQSVDVIRFEDGERREFDWIAGDRLVYIDDTRRNLILPLDVPVARGTSPALALPESLPGVIGTFDVSPDGTRIAFSLERPTANGGTRHEFHLTSNLVDGEPAALRRIAESVASEDDSALRWSLHGWSPDQTLLMVSNSGAGLTELGSVGTKLYTLPTDDPEVLNVSTLPSERSAAVRPVYRFSRPFDLGSSAQVSDFSPGPFVWQR